MKKVIIAVFCISFLISLPAITQETITLSTYYPSPFGVYERFVTNTLGVGDINASGGIDAGDSPDPAVAGQEGDVWIAGDVGIGGEPFFSTGGLNGSGLKLFGSQFHGGVDHDFSIWTNDANAGPSAAFDRMRVLFTEDEIRVGNNLRNMDWPGTMFTIEGSENQANNSRIASLQFVNDSNGLSSEAILGRISSFMASNAMNRGDLRFYTNDGNGIDLQMRIDDEGDVGIGTTNPSSGDQDLKLDVEGAIGADFFCDAAGNNCVQAPIGGGLDIATGSYRGNGNSGGDRNFTFAGVSPSRPIKRVEILGTTRSGIKTIDMPGSTMWGHSGKHIGTWNTVLFINNGFRVLNGSQCDALNMDFYYTIFY